jgi:aminocarboxymuconate-semialdehyde decarboxylase
MQDVPAAVAELRRALEGLGLHGVMVNDHVNGRTYDEPEFLPFWEAAEELGALVFFHQGDYRFQVGRYFLDNSIGNLVERAVTFGTLAAGGVLDRFPDLKLLLAHAGGYAPYAVARMDKAAGAFPPDTASPPPYKGKPEYAAPAEKPPSAYLRSFYYDCCTFRPENLRFLVDMVGVDRVLFGTDAPAPMVLTDGVRWVEGLDCLTESEKRAILVENATALLGRA